MKIKLGFVTNSSSMCYILDKRNLNDKEIELIAGNRFLPNPIYLGVGRASVYGEGQAVKDFLEWLKVEDAAWVLKYDGSWANTQTEWLQAYLDMIGIDNIIFVRASGEGIGGTVKHSRLISEKAVGQMEYH